MSQNKISNAKKNSIFSPPPEMALETDHIDDSRKILNLTRVHSATISRWPMRRRLSLGRRKLPTARLGGKKPRKGFFLVRLFRRVKMRSLKQEYSCMLKKLKSCYCSLVKDVFEAGSTIESFQQRMLMEASVVVPVMGISHTSFPYDYGVDRRS